MNRNLTNLFPLPKKFNSSPFVATLDHFGLIFKNWNYNSKAFNCCEIIKGM